MSAPNTPLHEVFVRSKRGLDHRHMDSLHAQDDEQALHNCRACLEPFESFKCI